MIYATLEKNSKYLAVGATSSTSRNLQSVS